MGRITPLHKAKAHTPCSGNSRSYLLKAEALGCRAFVETNLAYSRRMTPMRNDFAPLYRTAVGFDRLFALLDAAQTQQSEGYPPYNIERTSENDYRVEVAVAGFKPDELSVDLKEGVLTVSGRKTANDGETERRYLHRGLAERNFERRFQLADHVVVDGADLADGLLTITLRRELPEQLKARSIPIGTGAIEAPKAARIAKTKAA